MTNEVKYLNSSGHLLRFLNAPDLYPVNEYQSLVLATASEMAAIALAARQGRSLQSLSAWELCCGGGPVAVALKSLGLGYVQATDVNESALSGCRENAARNDLQLDCVRRADMFDDSAQRNYDLICCNPPCGVSALAVSQAPHLLQAVDGGNEGMEFTLDMLNNVHKRLRPQGSLVFIAVSTGHIARLSRYLDEKFPRRWRVLPGTPVAAPWANAESSLAKRLLAEERAFQPLIWQRPDGNFWRLSWVIEATLGSTFAFDRSVPPQTGFPLHPFGYQVEHDVALCDLIKRVSQDGFWLSIPRLENGGAE